MEMKKKLSIIVLLLLTLTVLVCMFLPFPKGDFVAAFCALVYSIMVMVRFIYLLAKRETSKALVIYVPTLLSVGVLVIRTVEHVITALLPDLSKGELQISFCVFYLLSLALLITLSVIHSLFARKSK